MEGLVGLAKQLAAGRLQMGEFRARQATAIEHGRRRVADGDQAHPASVEFAEERAADLTGPDEVQGGQRTRRLAG